MDERQRAAIAALGATCGWAVGDTDDDTWRDDEDGPPEPRHEVVLHFPRTDAGRAKVRALLAVIGEEADRG